MKRKKIAGIIILSIGIIAALSYFGTLLYNLWQEEKANQNAAQASQSLYEQIINIVPQSDKTAGRQENIRQDLIIINGESFIGIIHIPYLALKLPVNNEASDDRLDSSPCRYSGGFAGSLVICAHNYSRQFGKIRNLAYGDKLFITDANGNEHWYNVEFVTTVHESEVSAMTESAFDLSLFTCTLDRRHRTTVRCTKIDLKNPPEPESAIVKSQINGNVLLIQKYLNIIRSIQPDIPQVDEDGSFGPATHEAVRVFQKLNNLSADGSVGPLTWKKIVAVYNNASERD